MISSPSKPLPLAGEIAPTEIGAWVSQEEDRFPALEARYTSWLASLSRNEELFQRHIYDKEHPTQLDYRQHRARLHQAVASGEMLAIDLLCFESEEASAYVALIDKKLEALRAVLHDWHGPILDDTSLPNAFRQSVKDVMSGTGLQEMGEFLESKAGAKT